MPEKVFRTLWKGEFELLKITERDEEGNPVEITRFSTENFNILDLVEAVMKLPENFRNTVVLSIIGELERMKIDLINVYTERSLAEDSGEKENEKV